MSLFAQARPTSGGPRPSFTPARPTFVDTPHPIVTTDAPYVADPALVGYLASMGHCAAVWALLPRDCEPLQQRALHLISRYEQLQNGPGMVQAGMPLRRAASVGFVLSGGHGVLLFRALAPFDVRPTARRGHGYRCCWSTLGVCARGLALALAGC